MSPESKEFGQNVRKARREAKIALASFASMCGVSPSYIHRIETGYDKPSKQLSDKILKVLSVNCCKYEKENVKC